MQKLRFLFLLILPAVLTVSCSNNNAAVGANGGASSDAAASGGGSGSDMYYEYTSKTIGTKMNSGTSIKLYLSAGGGVRTEMYMSNPAVKQDKPGPMMIVIGNKDKPNQSITIDDDKKTYTINNLDSLDGGSVEKSESTVTKIGEEKILDFNCVHARVISNKSVGSFFKTVDTLDIWKSTDVPLQSFFRQYMDRMEAKTGNFMYSPAVAGQLKQMGCVGFQMRMEVRSKEYSVDTEVTKVQKGDFPKSMFEIPAGYTQTQE